MENDFDPVLCRLHSSDIQDLQNKYNVLQRYLDGNNGDKGIRIRLHDVEHYINLLDEKRKEERHDAKQLKMILITQSITFLFAIGIWLITVVLPKVL